MPSAYAQYQRLARHAVGYFWREADYFLAASLAHRPLLTASPQLGVISSVSALLFSPFFDIAREEQQRLFLEYSRRAMRRQKMPVCAPWMRERQHFTSDDFPAM